MPKNTKKDQPQNIYQYINWLYNSGRITKEEQSELYRFADQLEQDTIDLCV